LPQEPREALPRSRDRLQSQRHAAPDTARARRNASAGRVAALSRETRRGMDETAREAVDALLARLHRVPRRAAPAPRATATTSACYGAPVRYDEPCRAGRRGARTSGDEIADREIGLVAHARYDGDRRFEHRARDEPPR
jgi:uncharacterized membrane protein